MKPDIHPKYYPHARVICACGHTWTTGATVPEIRVDICSNCHPFYTGEQRIVDTAGRVDRFRMRLAQKREKKAEKPRKEKFVVIGPDEPVKAEARSEEAALITPAEAIAEAETIVNAPADATPQMAEPAAETAQPEAVAEPEYRVRTVVEGAGEGGEVEMATPDEDERPKRRAPRKPRAPKAEGVETAGEKPARRPRTRKTVTSEASAEQPAGAESPQLAESPAPASSEEAGSEA